MNKLNALSLLALLSIGSGCTHTVSYKLTEQDRWTGPKINKVVRIMPLTDQTTPPADKVLTVEDAKWRTNYRKGYKNEELAASVSNMVARHLAHSGLFKDVVYGGGQTCDWELTGTLKDYMAMGQVNSTAEGIQGGTAGFGLIGALIGAASTAKMHSEIRTSIKLEDLKLVDTATHAPVWTGSVCLSTNFSASFQAANEQVVFQHVDAMLKPAVAEIIGKLGTLQLDTSATRPGENASGTN